MIFNWIGDIDLDPPLDEWKETSRAPDIVVNLNGTFDNLRKGFRFIKSIYFRYTIR